MQRLIPVKSEKQEIAEQVDRVAYAQRMPFSLAGMGEVPAAHSFLGLQHVAKAVERSYSAGRRWYDTVNLPAVARDRQAPERLWGGGRPHCHRHSSQACWVSKRASAVDGLRRLSPDPEGRFDVPLRQPLRRMIAARLVGLTVWGKGLAWTAEAFKVLPGIITDSWPNASGMPTSGPPQ